MEPKLATQTNPYTVHVSSADYSHCGLLSCFCLTVPDVPNGPEPTVSNGKVSPQNGHEVPPPTPARDGMSPLPLAEATRTPEHIESLEETKYATALRGRRGALRQAKAQEFRGHKFVKKYFRKPTYCAYCKEMFWLVVTQGVCVVSV